MADRISKLQRWLDLVAYLASRRLPVPVEELREHIPAYSLPFDADDRQKESLRRKFERDKDELREMGIPIETVSYHINYGREEVTGYRLASRDFHLPYLRLVSEAKGEATDGVATPASPAFPIAEDEAAAALEGLRQVADVPGFPLAREARSAFRKLAFDLDPEGLGGTPVLYAEDPEALASAATLRVLSDALLHRKGVTFRYSGITRDTDQDRRVWPYGLLFQHGRWYLVAHDRDRDEPRMFRVGRMESPTANTRSRGKPDYDVPADFLLEEYAGRSAWELGDDAEGTVEATVVFRFPRSLWAERNGHGTLIQEASDGAQIRRFDVHRRDPFLRWVLSLQGDARVVAPDELADAFQKMAQRVVALHDAVGDAGPGNADGGAGAESADGGHGHG